MRKLKIGFKNWSRHQRNWYGKWHLYFGIIAGFIIAIVGITGSILAFREEIDAALNPSLFKSLSTKPRLSLAGAYENFHRLYPHSKVSYLYQPENSNIYSTYIFYDYANKKSIFVNPYNGSMCGDRLYESGFINIVTDIHTSLLIPKVGTYIVGIASLILLILTITGLRLWLPKKWKHFKEVITIKRGASAKRQNYDWHNVLGFYSAPVVTILSLTGFCITFYLPILAIVVSLSGKNPKEVGQFFALKSHYSTHAITLPPHNVAEIGEKQFPDGKVVGIALPNDSLGSYRLDVLRKGFSKVGNREMIVIDQYSGKVLGSTHSFPNVIQGLSSWMQPLHYGTFGGIVTRVLALIGGLIPVALFITGFIIWWPRWKKQKNQNKKITNPKEVFKKLNNTTFSHHFKQGFKYALWIAFLSASCGMIYGLLAGIVISPAAYAIIFTVPIVLVNFIVALIVNILHLIIAVPFGKRIRIFYSYFAISSSFFIVYIILYMLLMNTGLKIF